MTKQEIMDQAKAKVVMYRKLMKDGKSKMEAVEKVSAKFGSGICSATCREIHKELGLTDGEMKSRASAYRFSDKKVSTEPAKLVKPPVVTMEPIFQIAIDARLKEMAAEMLGIMKQNRLVAITIDGKAGTMSGKLDGDFNGVKLV